MLIDKILKDYIFNYFIISLNNYKKKNLVLKKKLNKNELIIEKKSRVI